MAITATDRGTGGNNSSEAATTVTPGSNLAAGSLGILVIAADNAATANNSNFPATITDSAGNTWTAQQDITSSSAANANLERVTYVSRLTSALTTSGSIVITYTVANVTAKAWTLTEAAPATAGNRLIVKFQNFASIATTGTPGALTAALMTQGEMVLGIGGAESADTWVGTSDASFGTWSTKQSTGFGSGASGMSVMSQYKILTGSGTVPFQPTLTSADMGLWIVVISEGPQAYRGSFGSNSSQAATTITFYETLAIGSTAVLLWTGDNAGTNGAVTNLPSSLTDSVGNTWTLRQDGLYDNGAASAGQEIGLYTSTLTFAIVKASTVAITYTVASVAAKTVAVLEFTDSTAYASSGVGTGATTTTPTVTTGSITNGNYVVGGGGAEAAGELWVADGDTTNGSWSSPIHIDNGQGGTNGSALFCQYKKVTGTGAQTFNPTVTSSDNILGYVELTAPVSQSATNAFFRLA